MSPLLPLLSSCLRSLPPCLSVSLVRADGLPSSYSGTPFLPPFKELASRCAGVWVKLCVGGEQFASSRVPHAASLRWNERWLLLAGPAHVEKRALETSLREQG